MIYNNSEYYSHSGNSLHPTWPNDSSSIITCTFVLPGCTSPHCPQRGSGVTRVLLSSPSSWLQCKPRCLSRAHIISAKSQSREKLYGRFQLEQTEQYWGIENAFCTGCSCKYLKLKLYGQRVFCFTVFAGQRNGCYLFCHKYGFLPGQWQYSYCAVCIVNNDA